jgi:NAD(P) transhydrogenase
MAVIGAGVIGSEYGCTFTALGAKVHIIDVRDKLLPFLDAEVSQALTAAMERSGVTFHWNESVQKCEVLPSGEVKLSLSSGASLIVGCGAGCNRAKRQHSDTESGCGRRETGEFGVIPVDHQFRTNVPHIFAAGDVIGFPALASTSMEQARRAVTVRPGAGRQLPLSLCCPTESIPFRRLAWSGKRRSRSRKSASTTWSVGRGMWTMREASSSATRTAFSSCSSAGNHATGRRARHG